MSKVNTISRQVVSFEASFKRGGRDWVLIADVRHDDCCNNGHNTLSITGRVYGRTYRPNEDCITRDGVRYWLDSCGMMHDEIRRYLPALAPLLQWHLVSTDGPLHYIANTVYHVQNGNLDYARSSAVWPDASDTDLLAPGLPERLAARLPALLGAFRSAVESVGLQYGADCERGAFKPSSEGLKRVSRDTYTRHAWANWGHDYRAYACSDGIHRVYSLSGNRLLGAFKPRPAAEPLAYLPKGVL